MKLRAKQFEEYCLARMRFEEILGRGTASRYGVMAHVEVQPGGRVTWHPVDSLPDLEGVLPPVGRQFIMDCKVESGSAVPLKEDHVPLRQLTHMLRRSKFGAVCCL